MKSGSFLLIAKKRSRIFVFSRKTNNILSGGIFEISRQWKLAPVFASFLIIGVSIVVFLKINPDKTENWNAKIEKASDAEIMAAIDLEKSENQELALQMVALSLKKNDILFQPEKLKKEDIEKSIDDLTENEIYNELDIN
jgi:hypothetical protein